MVDITVTAANVAQGTGAVVAHGTAGGTITAGMALYLDSADGKLKAADCDASEAAAAVVGIALHGASNNQPLAYQTDGRITIGGTVTVGEIYVASGTAGGVAPEADLAQNDYVSIIGVGVTAAIIDLAIHVSGVQVP